MIIDSLIITRRQLKITKSYPFTIDIDGEPVNFLLKRMNYGECLEFRQRARRSGEPTYLRFIERDPTSIPEMERNEDGEYKIPIADLANDKVGELRGDKRLEFKAALVEDEETAREFVKWIFDKFVKCAGGLIEEQEDGTDKSVTKGIDIIRIFGAREDVISQIVTAVREENTLSVEQKKILRSASDFLASSPAPEPVPDGTKQETTATSAEQGDSTETEGVTPEEPDPSGSTGISSCTDAQLLA